MLATADQLAASKGQAEGTGVEAHDWKGVLTLTFALAMVIGNLGAGFVAESMSWMWVPALMAVLCGLALVVGLRGRRIRDQYLVQVTGEKEAEAANRVLGSSWYSDL